jgi:hypothetical protein
MRDSLLHKGLACDGMDQTQFLWPKSSSGAPKMTSNPQNGYPIIVSWGPGRLDCFGQRVLAQGHPNARGVHKSFDKLVPGGLRPSLMGEETLGTLPPEGLSTKRIQDLPPRIRLPSHLDFEWDDIGKPPNSDFGVYGGEQRTPAAVSTGLGRIHIFNFDFGFDPGAGPHIYHKVFDQSIAGRWGPVSRARPGKSLATKR